MNLHPSDEYEESGSSACVPVPDLTSPGIGYCPGWPHTVPTVGGNTIPLAGIALALLTVGVLLVRSARRSATRCARLFEVLDSSIVRMRVYEDDYGWTSFDKDDVDDPDSFVVDIPAAAWATYQEALEASERAHAALCELVGLSTLGAAAVKPCDDYVGRSEDTISGLRWWTSCRRCNHPMHDHQVVADVR